MEQTALTPSTCFSEMVEPIFDEVFISDTYFSVMVESMSSDCWAWTPASIAATRDRSACLILICWAASCRPTTSVGSPMAARPCSLACTISSEMCSSRDRSCRSKSS